MISVLFNIYLYIILLIVNSNVRSTIYLLGLFSNVFLSWSDLLKEQTYFGSNQRSNEEVWKNSSLLLMKMNFHIRHRIQTPMIIAADLGNTIVMQYILSHSKDYMWIKNGYGKSALELASKNGHIDIVRLLVRLPLGRQNRRNSNGLRFAAMNGHAKVVKILSLHTRQPNRPNEHGVFIFYN